MVSAMNIIPGKVAPPYESGDTKFTGYAAPSRGATEISLWRIEMAAGSSSPLHEMDVEEVFLAVRGEAVAAVGGVESTVGVGDCLVLPARTPFTLTAGPEEPFQAVACMRAGGRATLVPSGESFLPPWAQ